MVFHGIIMSFNVFGSSLHAATAGVIDRAIDYGLSKLLNDRDKFGLFTNDGLPFYQKKSAGKLFHQTVVNPIHVGVVGVTYSGSSSVTNAPVENGQFISINKVIMPRMGQVVYAYTGLVDHIKIVEERLEEYERNEEPLLFKTRERSIQNVTITSHNIIRSAESGKSLVTVEINFQEILFTAKNSKAIENQTVEFHNDSRSQGTIDPVHPTGSQQQSAKKTPG